MYLTQGLHRAVQQRPDAVATVFGDRVTTFSQQFRRVSGLAGGLREIGVRRGDRVAFLGLNSDRYCEYYLAVPWADATVNPVNIRWTPVEVAASLDDSQTRVLIVDDTFSPAIAEISEHYPHLDTVIYAGEGTTPPGMVCYENLVSNGPHVHDARRGGQAMAGLFYTGGTTGVPKAVILSHANLIASALGIVAAQVFSHIDGAILHAAPLFHLAALSELVISTLIGRTQVILPSFNPTAVLQAVEEHRIKGLRLVPIMLQLLLDHPRLDDFDLSSVSSVGYGGSSIAESLLLRAIERLPHAKFVQAFGQTELSPVTALLGPDGHAPDGRAAGLLRSAGRAGPHAEVRIIDHEGAPLPSGHVGEIVVRGAHVMRGYWRRPAETAAALRDGWMHTGDAGYMDANGYLFVVDRIRDIIVSGGENVYCAEVENAIASHPKVVACAVIGVSDALWGERVHAVIEPVAGAEITIDELRLHTERVLAAFKRPRSIELVDALPVSASGKVLKAKLRADAADRGGSAQ
jgi:acyl-CoA synthetase (AMP-forming)/AMP-acid ligase II